MWPLHDLCVFIKLSAKVITNHIQTYRLIISYVPYKLSIAHLKKICRWIGYISSQIAMIFANSSMNMWRSHDGSAKVDGIGRDKSMIYRSNKLIHIDSLVNIYLDLNYRQKKNGWHELKKVLAEKYYEKSIWESVLSVGKKFNMWVEQYLLNKKCFFCLNFNNFQTSWSLGAGFIPINRRIIKNL